MNQGRKKLTNLKIGYGTFIDPCYKQPNWKNLVTQSILKNCFCKYEGGQ